MTPNMVLKVGSFEIYILNTSLVYLAKANAS